MAPAKQSTEEAIVPSFNQTTEQEEYREEQREEGDESLVGFKSFLWHGGSVYDAWFSCASNQVSYYMASTFQVP